MAETKTGAVDYSECLRGGCSNGWRPCQCGKCCHCGYPKHAAIHGPFWGQPPGSEPYGHQFEPERATR
jgi:hypothetical protein